MRCEFTVGEHLCSVNAVLQKGKSYGLVFKAK